MKVLILGATSSIARACAEACAAKKYKILLAGRNALEIERIAADLRIRFQAEVDYILYDALDPDTNFFQNVLQKLGGLDGIIVAVGLLGKQYSPSEIITVNFSSVVILLEQCAKYLAQQKKGFIIGFSSVAGDRGRKANYIYGACKSALTTYLQGLRATLHPFAVYVLTVKLGLIDTKMTFGSDYPVFLAADPHKTGRKIIEALERKKESVYIPKIWRFIMWIIRSIPEKMFKRLHL